MRGFLLYFECMFAFTRRQFWGIIKAKQATKWLGFTADEHVSIQIAVSPAKRAAIFFVLLVRHITQHHAQRDKREHIKFVAEICKNLEQCSTSFKKQSQ